MALARFLQPEGFQWCGNLSLDCEHGEGTDLFCCAHDHAAARLFSRLARWYRFRYHWLGLEASQRQLVAGLARIGYQKASLLEIGCGVGWLHQWLLRHGAAAAVGVDLSPALLAEAEALAREQGLEGRVRYLTGDFLQLAASIEPADLVVLDKVICCYPDARTLLRRAAAKARRAVALTYPRIHLLSRAGVAWLNRFLALVGSDFRVYLHDSHAVASWLAEAGFRKADEACTWLWLTQVFTQIKESSRSKR